MNPGKLKDRIKIYRFVKSADGYGGFTSNTLTDLTIWGYAKEKKGEFIMNDGSRKKYKEVEVIVRKKSFNEITNTDFEFQINQTGMYRANDVFESDIDKYVTITGTSL